MGGVTFITNFYLIPVTNFFIFQNEKEAAGIKASDLSPAGLLAYL